MIKTPLLPHQARIVESQVTKGNCLGIFTPFGTGKSLTALAIVEKWASWPVLITSDRRNVPTTWPIEIGTHTDSDYSIHNIHSPHYVVTTYDKLKHNLSYFTSIKFGGWIGDESSMFKNPNTLRFKALMLAVRDIPRRIILSGQLATEHLEEVWGQMYLLDGGRTLGSSRWGFMQKYMYPHPAGFGWLPKKGAADAILHRIAATCEFLRPGEEPIMPEKVHIEMECPLTEQQVDIDTHLRKEYRTTIEGDRWSTVYAMAVFQKRLQISGGTFYMFERPIYLNTEKLATVENILTKHEEKVIIWISYLAEVQPLIRLARNMRRTYIVVTGKHSSSDDLEWFNSTKDPAVAVCSVGCARGLNHFSNVATVVNYSFPLSYMTYSQAEARCCRISSKHPVTTYYDLVTDKGLDRHVYEMLQRKKDFTLNTLNLQRVLA